MALFSKDDIKRKLRRTTDQKEPFTRPKESKRAQMIRERLMEKSQKVSTSQEDVDDMNEARKKWLKERAKKK